MANTSQKVRDWTGPAVLAYGYRPFFLSAGIWAALAMVLWIMMLSGGVDLPTRFDPISWHAHEFLFGYLPAVMAGFLLTAVPNWTGRLPLIGWRLGALAGLWLVGRVAVAFSAYLSPLVTALADMVFLGVFAAAIGREILAGKNWRNLVVVGMLGVLILANGIFHWQAAQGQVAASGLGFRLGLGAGIMMISLIGGRIVPSFTRNWLVRNGAEARPAAVARFDQLSLATSLIAVLAWVVAPTHLVSAILLLLAGTLGLVRLARWAGGHTASEPLVWVLHVGFSFVPLGFLALGASHFTADPMIPVAAQHIWMAGAIGLMTLAVMTRASLGHAGRPLAATRAITTLYLMVILAVVARLAVAIWPGVEWPLYVAAFAWICAFGGFSVVYWPILTRRRAAVEKR